MRSFVKEMVMGLLIWSCIIWVVCFDPNQFGHWLKVAICLGSATAFFWWIFDFGKLIKEDNKETV